MANNDYKSRIKRLNQKMNEITKFTHPVIFFNSVQEKEIKEFALRNPHAVIFIGEDLLED